MADNTDTVAEMTKDTLVSEHKDIYDQVVSDTMRTERERTAALIDTYGEKDPAFCLGVIRDGLDTTKARLRWADVLEEKNQQLQDKLVLSPGTAPLTTDSAATDSGETHTTPAQKPTGRALYESEWDDNLGKCQDRFRLKDVYITYRQSQDEAKNHA